MVRGWIAKDAKGRERHEGSGRSEALRGLLPALRRELGGRQENKDSIELSDLAVCLRRVEDGGDRFGRGGRAGLRSDFGLVNPK